MKLLVDVVKKGREGMLEQSTFFSQLKEVKAVCVWRTNCARVRPPVSRACGTQLTAGSSCVRWFSLPVHGHCPGEQRWRGLSRVASLWRPNEAWLRRGWPVSQLALYAPSLPLPSFGFSPSSWSCDSYFSSLLIQNLARLQLAEQTVSIWLRCCVARTTACDEGTIWGWAFSGLPQQRYDTLLWN